MTNNRRSNANQVAVKLFSHEAIIDAALTSNSELIALMLRVRQDSNLSALLGHEALEAVIETGNALFKARTSIVVSHKALAVVQEQIGLGPTAFGGFIDKQADTAMPIAAVRIAA